MVVDTVPALLPTFAIRILTKLATIEERRVTGSITGPSGVDIIKFEGTVKVETIKYMSSFSFKISPLLISSLGKHDIKLGIESSPKVISSFDVITKEQMRAR